MSTMTSGNDIVDIVGCMQFKGNVIPQEWYKNIKKDTGKPDLLAIVILADIVYWYRPTEVRDEATGQLKGYKTKFHYDLLQRDYEAFANLFGVEKRNVRDAMTRLEKLGVIRREFRTIVTPTGIRCSNILFVELIPNKLYELTYGRMFNQPMTKNGNRVDENRTLLLPKNDTPNTENGYVAIPKNVIGGTKNRKTNTKNITEITTEIISSSSISPPQDDEDDFKKQIDYRKAYELYGDTATVIHEELCKDDNSDIASGITKQSFEELCRSISEYASPIRNLSAYIRVCLSNMAAGQRVKRRCSFNQHMKNDDISDWETFEKSILAN